MQRARAAAAAAATTYIGSGVYRPVASPPDRGVPLLNGTLVLGGSGVMSPWKLFLQCLSDRFCAM